MPPMTYRDLTPEDAQRELLADPTLKLLDVRTPREHQSHRLANATLVPVQELMQRTGELDPEQHWFVYCEHGRRSLLACDILTQSGFGKLTNIRGGMANWAQQGLPFERG